MKHYYTFLLSFFAFTHAFTQNIRIDPASVRPLCRSEHRITESGVSELPPERPLPHPAGKSQTVSPIQLGRASNAYTIIRAEQNQVIANDSLNIVAFIHRQDISLHGGTINDNGKYRFDLSTDGGNTFQNNLNLMNPAYLKEARYPNLALYNPGGNTDPDSARFVYVGPTLSGGVNTEWDGMVAGVTNINPAGFQVHDEQYLYQGTDGWMPGALTEGQHGVFWTVDRSYVDSLDELLDTIRIYKAVLAPAYDTLAWTETKLVPAWEKNIPDADSSFGPKIIGPNIAFSPDGQTGWVAMLGDLTGGHDSVYSPIFIKSTDAGQTWGTPVEVDLRTIGWIADSLQDLWIAGYDSSGSPVPTSTGNPTTGFEFDLTVDQYGNPHLFTVIGSASTQDTAYEVVHRPDYSFIPELAKIAADIYSTDGGATWQVLYVAPVLSFKYEIQSSGEPLVMYNCTQISRTSTGEEIFFSWTDTDTMTTGFGVSANNVPNLMISAFRPSDGYRTCYHSVTRGDLLWEGRALFPSMAPEVLLRNIYYYHFPIVMLYMDMNDPLLRCSFYYFGNDAVFIPSSFVHPQSYPSYDWVYMMTELWFPCTPISVDPASAHAEAIELYPNPASDHFSLRFEMPQSSDVTIKMIDQLGREILQKDYSRLAAGPQELRVETSTLPKGLYFLSLQAEGLEWSQKVIVE